MVNKSRQAGAIEDLLVAENNRLTEENRRIQEIVAETSLNLSSLQEEIGIPLRRLKSHLTPKS